MSIDPQSQTHYLAVAVPGAVQVLERWGVDYCSPSDATLDDRCAAANVSVEDVLADLERAASSRDACAEPLQSASVCELVEAIRANAHASRDVPWEGLCAGLAVAWPALRGPLNRLNRALADHAKRDASIFERLHALQLAREGRGPWPLEGADALRNDLVTVEEQNREVCDALRALERTSREIPPPGNTDQALRLLAELRAEVHRLVHLENNLLLPRARDLFGSTIATES